MDFLCYMNTTAAPLAPSEFGHSLFAAVVLLSGVGMVIINCLLSSATWLQGLLYAPPLLHHNYDSRMLRSIKCRSK
jgi:hypothetical protein